MAKTAVRKLSMGEENEGSIIPVLSNISRFPRSTRGAARVRRLIAALPTETHGAKEIVMAKVIMFYVPKNFRKQLRTPQPKRGRVIEFCAQVKKSA